MFVLIDIPFVIGACCIPADYMRGVRLWRQSSTSARRTLRKWIVQAQVDSGNPVGPTTEELDEIKKQCR